MGPFAKQILVCVLVPCLLTTDLAQAASLTPARFSRADRSDVACFEEEAFNLPIVRVHHALSQVTFRQIQRSATLLIAALAGAGRRSRGTPEPAAATMTLAVRLIDAVLGRQWAIRYIGWAWCLETLGLGFVPAGVLAYFFWHGTSLVWAAPWVVGLPLLFAFGHAGRLWLSWHYGIWIDYKDVAKVAVRHAFWMLVTLAAAHRHSLWMLTVAAVGWRFALGFHATKWVPVAWIDARPVQDEKLQEILREYLGPEDLGRATTVLSYLQKYTGGLANKRILQIDPETPRLLLAMHGLGVPTAQLQGLRPGAPFPAEERLGLPIHDGDILSPPPYVGPLDNRHPLSRFYHLLFSDRALDRWLENAAGDAERLEITLRFLREAARMTVPTGINVHLMTGKPPIELTDLKDLGFECLDPAEFEKGVIALRRLAWPKLTPLPSEAQPEEQGFYDLRQNGLGDQIGVTQGVIVRPVPEDKIRTAHVFIGTAGQGQYNQWRRVVSSNEGFFDVHDETTFPQTGLSPELEGEPLLDVFFRNWLQKALYDPEIGLLSEAEDRSDPYPLVFIGTVDETQSFNKTDFPEQRYQGKHVEGMFGKDLHRSLNYEIRDRLNRLISGVMAVKGPIDMSRFKYILVPEILAPIARRYFADPSYPEVVPVRGSGAAGYETALREVLGLEKDRSVFWWATRFTWGRDHRWEQRFKAAA